MLAGQWEASRNVIQEPGDVEKLNNVCTFWLDTATIRLKATQVEKGSRKVFFTYKHFEISLYNLLMY